MNRSLPIIFGLLAAVVATWYAAFAATRFPPDSALLWIVRDEGLYLSGFAAIALMSLTMLLATRPGWLEGPLGGMDRIYRLHKWTGILALAIGFVHWLIELSDELIEEVVGEAGELPEADAAGWLEETRELAGDLGEWAFYAALALLALTLWKRFPYLFWRYVHRAMPVLYLLLAFHAALLAPPDYWTQPAGALLALCLAVGVAASLVSLAGRIGRHRQAAGTVVAIRQHGTVAEIDCRLTDPWPGHRPGQFAFVTFDRWEGAHPFTIASADRGDGTLSFCVKELGDYTRTLAQKLRIGQPVRIEGPYGRFDYARSAPRSRQIWVAGGIGVTPFFAWLEALQARPETAPRADLHYCTRDRNDDFCAERLAALCARLPTIRLHVHGARQGETLNAAALDLAAGQGGKTEVWFCGPQGLAATLRGWLAAGAPRGWRLHQEAFEMR